MGTTPMAPGAEQQNGAREPPRRVAHRFPHPSLTVSMGVVGWIRRCQRAGWAPAGSSRGGSGGVVAGSRPAGKASPAACQAVWYR